MGWARGAGRVARATAIETNLGFPLPAPTVARMSTVQEIETAIRKLTPAELQQVHEWLEDFIEEQMEFTPKFEAEIRASERELAAGLRPRVRQPGATTPARK